MYKATAIGRVQGPSCLLRPDGTYTVSEEQRILLLLETDFPDKNNFQNNPENNFSRQDCVG